MGILITGGLGFIGSHQAVHAVASGHDVVIVDDLSNSHRPVINRIATITGTEPVVHILDVRQTRQLTAIMADTQPEAVIHFAGKKHVGESVTRPQDYYDCNLGGMLSVIEACEQTGVRNLVFSSSGSIYGETTRLPINEEHPANPTNPYSRTKAVGEQILADLCTADPTWSAVALRYFNPAGAHPSATLGEWCKGKPSNLLPRLIETAYQAATTGERPTFAIHGDTYNTPDGTGVRDYVHVTDVVEAHLRALDLMIRTAETTNRALGFKAYNIGRGEGVSVRQLINAVQQASGQELDVHVGPRRPGDVSALYGDTNLAAKELDMTDYRTLEEICLDAWRFRVNNPDGY